ncbi:MAG: hypothetical protein R3Y10_02960 [Ferrimonas sp.]
MYMGPERRHQACSVLLFEDEREPTLWRFSEVVERRLGHQHALSEIDKSALNKPSFRSPPPFWPVM